jgi:hypothetical protein
MVCGNGRSLHRWPKIVAIRYFIFEVRSHLRFSPIPGSVIRGLVQFEVRSFSSFSHSRYGHFRASVIRGLVLFEVQSFEVRSFDIQSFEIRSFEVRSFDVRSQFRVDNVIIPLDLTQLFCPGFTLSAGSPSGFTTDIVGCWRGALSRACNLTAFIYSSTGPVVHLFSSHHEGPGFNPQGGTSVNPGFSC